MTIDLSLDLSDTTLTTLLILISTVAVFLANSFHFRKKRPPKNAQRPPHVSSFVPYVGSAITMGTGIYDFIHNNGKKHNNTPVFTATIMGETCAFLPDPRFIQSVIFKGSLQKYLDAESLQKDFLRNVLGFTNEEFKMLDGFWKVGNSQYMHYLFKNEQLDPNIVKVQEYFTGFVPTLASNKHGWTQHDMFNMVVTAIWKASVGPLVSVSMTNDAAVQAFVDFDAGVIPLFNGVPPLFLKKTSKARAELMRQLTSDAFWESASGMMKARRDTFLWPAETLAKANLGVLWASVGNSAPAVFWVLIHLLEDEIAWKACREQVEQVDKERASDFFTLQDLDKLTLLDSAFWEALRLYMAAFTARTVKADFVFDTDRAQYYIEKGWKLMAFFGMLHMDPHVFENPEEFKYDRFTDKNKTFTYQDGSPLNYFPVVTFGGGSHLCPGRKFISYEARLFVAMLMLQFEMRLAPGETRPGVNLAQQGIGVNHPERDPKVEIRLRQH
jgi:oxysterol 7-alpha-hydroxylase